MSCEHLTESLNALLDGELPPEQAAVLAAHLATCPACAATLSELAELRAGLAQLVPVGAPAALQARIEALLAPEGAEIIPFTPKPRRWLPNRPGWAAAAALAAALMLTFLPHHDETKDLMGVRDAALRGTPAVYANAGAPAPAVPGFQLTATRMDEVAGHMARVADYTRAGQSITLCIWAANGEPAHGVKHAEYHDMAISYWNDGTHEYWAASTAPGSTLQDFVAALAIS